jgi:uncharacterized protein YceK
MQKRAMRVLVLGFISGLALSSCASMTSERSASRGVAHSLDGEDSPKKERECGVGEKRSSSGECVASQEFDRPFRRNGR